MTRVRLAPPAGSGADDGAGGRIPNLSYKNTSVLLPVRVNVKKKLTANAPKQDPTAMNRALDDPLLFIEHATAVMAWLEPRMEP